MRALLDLFQHGYAGADFRALLQPPGWTMFYAQCLLDRIAGWSLLTTVTVLAFQAGGSGAAALTLLAFVLPRAVLTWLNVPAAGFLGGWWLHSLRLLLVLALFAVSFEPRLLLLVALALPLGALNTLADHACAARIGRENPGVASALLGRVEPIGLLLGSLLAALTLVAWDATVALGVTAALFLLTAILTAPLFGSAPRRAASEPAIVQIQRIPHGAPQSRALLLIALGLFAGALAAMTVRAALIEVVDEHGHTDAVYAALIAAVGAGALVGPLSMPKLLGHISAYLAVALISIALGFGLIFMSRDMPVMLFALVLFVSGLLSVTLDLIAGTVARRLIPAGDLEQMLPVLTNTVLIGQLAGLVATLGLTQLVDAGDVLLIVGTLCVLGPAVVLVLGWRRRWADVSAIR